MKTVPSFCALTCLVLITGLANGPANAQEPSASVGESTYMRVGCYQCHGTDGKGNDAGPALTPDPLPPEAIANFIRNTPGRMPVYPEEVVSNKEIADMVAWLETVPLPPNADDIDILKDLKPGS